MNMSLKELVVWIISADFPSFADIWTWLITVPWWLAIITIYIFWLLAKGTVVVSLNAYSLLSKRSYQLGEWVSFWSGQVKAACHQMLAAARAFGAWLLRVLAIR